MTMQQTELAADPSISTIARYAPSAQRYHGAWQEINARLQSRQNIQGAYMTGAVVVLFLGLLPPTTGRFADPDTWRIGVALVLPVLSLSVALWVRHNDALIGLLSAYCQWLERLDDPDGTSELPGWHDNRYGMIDAGLQYRRFSDYAYAMITAVATAPTLGVAFPGLWRNVAQSAAAGAGWIAGLAFCVGVLAIWFALTNVGRRAKLKDQWVFGMRNGRRRWGWIGTVEIDSCMMKK